MGYTPSFTPQYENGWEDLPSETSPITAEALNAYDDAIENIEEYLEENEIVDANTNLADEYDPEEGTYAVDDYCIHDNVLYKCLTAVNEPEDFDEEKWEPVLVTDVMGSGSGGSSTLAGLDDVAITSPTNGQVIKYNSTTQKWENGEGGGGGNANIWTGTMAEYEAQASQIADDTLVNITDDEGEIEVGGEYYSTYERCVGTWTNGKPLYQKTYTGLSISLGTNSWTTLTGVTITNGEDLVKAECYGEYTEQYLLNCTKVHLNKADGSVEIRNIESSTTLTAITLTYTKSTDSAIPLAVKTTPSYEVYSTDEQIIGQWIDGKPIYRRAIPITSEWALQANTWVKSNISASGIDYFVDGRLIVEYQGTKSIHFLQIAQIDGYIAGNCFRSMSANVGCYLILEYTKTSS